eukprot:TRINITY_DN12508_c0_g1_i1.p1 TRINITY_DN12508_c0_g1~~TRINITY_DN12508_c0_g1_i1.p1  ORF type:complete len:337 (-),score=97.12 TRINITY_DN12508_c0_g1_i1:13-951(-)
MLAAFDLDKKDLIQDFIDNLESDITLHDNLLLKKACIKGYASMVKQIMNDPRTDHQIKKGDDSDPLECACLHGNLEIIRFLLEFPNTKLYSKADALTTLVRFNRTEATAQILFMEEDGKFIFDSQRMTDAIKMGRNCNYQPLIDALEDPRFQMNEFNYADLFFWANVNSFTDILEMLLKRKGALGQEQRKEEPVFGIPLKDTTPLKKRERRKPIKGKEKEKEVVTGEVPEVMSFMSFENAQSLFGDAIVGKKQKKDDQAVEDTVSIKNDEPDGFSFQPIDQPKVDGRAALMNSFVFGVEDLNPSQKENVIVL